MQVRNSKSNESKPQGGGQTAHKPKGVANVAETEARKEWTKKNTTRVGLKLNNNTDADIIKRLGTVPSVQGYIKSLVRADIKKN